MNNLKKILDLLSFHERKRGFLLLGMILTMSLLDVIGVASILPFLAVLADLEMVKKNQLLNFAYSRMGFTNPHDFLFILGIFFLILLVFSLAFKALTTYAQLRFTLLREYSIGKSLIEGYLHQPYSWFLGRHSADLGKTILSDVNLVINQCVTPMINLIAHGAIVLALLSLLILINPHLALVVGFTLTAAYAFVFMITRRFLARIGRERVKANQNRFAAVGEAFGAIKELKISGLEEIFIQRFEGPARIFAGHQAASQVISQLPRFALEAIAFSGMLSVVLYLMSQNGSFTTAMPIIALYALAAYRLMPSLQQIYGALTQLRFASPALDVLHADLMSLRKTSNHRQTKEILMLEKNISLNHVTYGYPNTSKKVLKNLSLSIPVKSRVGLIGATGSGKTTIVDLILGLIEPQQGELMIDGKAVTDRNRRGWQQNIGYVPQQIYLMDDTITANIAFGLEIKDINQKAIERAAKIANLHDFVFNELPLKYETTIGERGVRLSGGQRQRIGIARALYKNPRVLVLDEATSALDNITEAAVMDAVHNLGHEITIILIAHRLSTVKSCDTIFLLEKGELKAQGSFDELLLTNEYFRTMATK